MNTQDSAIALPDDQVTFEVVIAKTDARLEREFVAKQGGSLNREVAVSKEGEVFVIVRWMSLGDAEAARAGFMTAPTGSARMEMSDLSLFAHSVKQ
jgi:hypothetical protein